MSRADAPDGSRHIATSGRLGDLLVACLRPPSPGRTELLRHAVANRDLGDLAAEAEHHNVLPAVYEALRSVPGAPGPILEALADRRRFYLHHHLRILAELRSIAEALETTGVAWCILKGPVLAEHVYPPGVVRSYVDLDILVHPAGFGRAIERLEAADVEVVDVNWLMVRAARRSEVSLDCPRGTRLDLHWHLFNDPRLRRLFRVDIDELLRRRRTVAIGGIPMPTLDAPDTLIHVAAHAAVAGGFRLGWMRDLDQVIRRDCPPWDVVVARARASGLALPVAIMLERARRMLLVDVPREVLDGLAPPWGWRRLVGLLDRARPPQDSFGRRLTGRAVISSTRRSAPESVVELARTAVRDRVVPFVTDSRHPLRRRLARREPAGELPNPLHQAAGGVEERRRYFSEVAATSRWA